MQRYISNIIIKKLFGHYDYDFEELKNNKKDTSNLLILYGGNGSGKTTILKTIYYLLSHDQNHKKNIFNIKFNLFSIVFSDGVIVSAIRKSNNIEGSYVLKINTHNEGEIFEIFFKSDENFGEYSKNLRVLEKVLEFLKYLNKSIFYLTDKRKLLTMDKKKSSYTDYGEYQLSSVAPLYTTPDWVSMSPSGISGIVTSSEEDSIEKILEDALDDVTQMIQKQSLLDSKKGDQDTNEIYLDVIKHILSPTKRKQIKDISSLKDNMLKKIKSIYKINKSYSKFGFFMPFNFNEFLETISSLSQKEDIVYRVLEPYFEGIDARIKALEVLYNSLSYFIKNLNSFFSNKKVSFNIGDGFKINYKNGDEITVSSLSSGEKQLLLFCNAFLARNKATLFLIDEPEISLNIKWQRKLLKSLLGFKDEGIIQYVIASHALELITPHRSSVIRLKF